MKMSVQAEAAWWSCQLLVEAAASEARRHNRPARVQNLQAYLT